MGGMEGGGEGGREGKREWHKTNEAGMFLCAW